MAKKRSTDQDTKTRSSNDTKSSSARVQYLEDLSPKMREDFDCAAAPKEACHEGKVRRKAKSSVSAEDPKDVSPQAQEKYEWARAKREKPRAISENDAQGEEDAAEVPKGRRSDDMTPEEREEFRLVKAKPRQATASKGEQMSLGDLTPEQREKYEKAMAKRKKESPPPSDPTGKPKSLENITTGPREKYERAKAQRTSRQSRSLQDLTPEDCKKYDRAMGNRQAEAERASGKDRKSKRLEDLRPEEREKHARDRAKRKQMKEAALKAGEGSGLSVEEKELLE